MAYVWMPKFNLKNILYTRGFSDIDCKLNIDGSINCCVYLIYMHNIVYKQSKYGMPDSLNYEYTHTQISYFSIFIKISKRPTLKGPCRLEGSYQIFTRHKPILRQNNK